MSSLNLPLALPGEEGEALNPLWLLSFMIYPNVEQQKDREKLIAALFFHTLYKSGYKGSVPHVIAERLLYSPPPEKLTSLVSNMYLRGRLAGSVLCALHKMCLDGVSEPSIKKARFLVHKDLEETTTLSGKSTKCSTKKLAQCFEEFRSVVHLHAAMYNLDGPVHRSHNISGENSYSINLLKVVMLLCNGDGIRFFLAVAERYRKFGEQFCPARQKNPAQLLAPGSTWTPPSGFPLPEVQLDNSTRCSFIPEVLKSYTHDW